MKYLRSTRLKFVLSTIAVVSLGACGGANSVVTSTPSLAFIDPQSTYDLNNYTQTGTCALPVGTGANLLAAEASGVTYNKDTDSVFVVGDGATSIAQINKTITGANCTLINSMILASGTFVDTEGITYAGGGKFVLVEERLRQVDQVTYSAGTTLNSTGAQAVKLGTTVGNVGIEGVTFDPKTNGYIAVRQSQPTNIFQAVIDFVGLTATASDSSAITVNTVNPPVLFDASLAGLSAFNDVFALSNIVPTTAPDYDSLLLIGAPDGKIVKTDRSGKLLSSLSMSPSAQNEGVTMGPDGTIYAVGEQAAGPSLPGMTIFTPTTSKSNVGVGSNLYLTFDQPILAAGGVITLSNGAGDTRSIAVTDTTQVTFSGKVMKIHPKYFLVANTSYNLTYAAGVLKTTSGSAISAVSGSSVLSFTTIGTPDTTVPTLNSSAPVNGAAGIAGSHVSLFFSESVQAGSGNIVITNGTDTRNVAVNDTTQVKFIGSRATITLATPLQNSSNYNVQIASGVITDLSGNAYAGINNATTLSFTTAAAGAPAPSLLITEVNSNAAGGDFFELYNYGNAPIVLTGWKWGDNHADVNDANNTAPFAAGKTLAPGARLVVLSVVPSAIATFQTNWGGLAGVDVVAMLNVNNDAANPIGLGSGDAVIVYDANGSVVASMNYGLTPLNATDGSGNLIAIPTASGVTIAGHAGASVGGNAKASAAWNGVSTTAPQYVSAVVGTLGGFAQPSVAAAVGSPGQ
jgi:uncharacterized protein YjiK